MRIVGGRFGGRRLVLPKDARVRPTADRVREAWMSILGDALPDARVLDLFAGSGALGLEALSRGARSATFVELNAASLAALKQNIATLGVDHSTTVYRGDARRYGDSAVTFCSAPWPASRCTPDRSIRRPEATRTWFGVVSRWLTGW